MAGRASHDADDHRGHAALHCTRFGHRNIFRFHSALPSQNVVVDRRSVGLSLQQDRCCHCGHTARRSDLGDACDLHCRIPFGLLESASPARASDTLPAIRAARLSKLACVFASRLAHLLACICRLAFPCHSVSNHHLFLNANAGESRADASENRLSERA